MYQLRTMLYSIFLSFPLMPFFCSMISPRDNNYITFSCHVSVGFSWLWQIFLLFFMTLTTVRNTGQVFQRMSQLDLSDVFVMISLGLGRKTTEAECHRHYIPSAVHTIDIDLIIGAVHTWLR